MHRFFVTIPLKEGPLLIPDSAIAHQVRHVLRMKPGNKIVLFGGRVARDGGWDFLFRIDSLKDQALEGEVIAKARNDRESRVTLTLYQATLKKDNMEWIFAKGTEVGIARFAPVLAERSVKTRVQYERAVKIVKEAAEQSGRAFFPDVLPIVPFAEAVKRAKKEGALNILAHEREHRKRMDALPLTSMHINLFIGPEGGFSPAEVAEAEAAGFFITSLSKRVLRAETAAIVGSYAVLHRFGN